MAASPNPLQQLVMQALQAKTAAGGGGTPSPGIPGMGGGGEAGGDMGPAYAEQVAEFKAANPSMLMQQIKRIKQMCAVLMVQNLERLPNVAGQLAKIVPQFDRVLKEIQQAGNVDAAVRPPIAMGAAQPPMEGRQPGAF